MALKIETLNIERFRAIRSLKLEGLKRVNLITGKNNSGKSSVLEALRILADNCSPAVISGILHEREEDVDNNEYPGSDSSDAGFSQIRNLFHNYPQKLENLEPIFISAIGDESSRNLKIGVEWIHEERTRDGAKKIAGGVRGNIIAEGFSQLALALDIGGLERFVPLEAIRSRDRGYCGVRSEFGDIPQIPTIFVSPYSGETTSTLSALWDAIAISDHEVDVIQALRIIDKNIKAVTMIGSGRLNDPRIAVVQSNNIPHPVPLRSFGAGMNHLFGIILSAVNASNGLLLIEEFENGIHHTIQTDVWRVIFNLARRLNIQVFATTHDWDSIEAFQIATAEFHDEGQLIRLTRKGEDTIPTRFSEEDLAIVTRERIEVR